MMNAALHSVRVQFPGVSYEVRIGEGLLGAAGQEIRSVCGGGSAAIVVSDSNVAPLYAAALCASLEDAGVRVIREIVPAGEASKSLDMVARVCNAMIAGGLDRTSFLVALGGGVVGDLAGFAAAIFQRGIPYAQIPTTLLAQVDSSVGGKTGVNAPGGKNLLGAFHHPAIVIADTSTLATLPQREFCEGMAEVLKHGVIRDAGLIVEAGALAHSDRAALIARNVAIKAAIVADDPEERLGLRALLNFGHTVGHAIEQAAGYGRFLHGEAISMGMAVALRISQSLAGLPAAEVQRTLDALRAQQLPVQIPADLTPEILLPALFRDKKFQSGRIRFVLSGSLGTAFVSETVTEHDIREAIVGATSEP